MYGQSTPRMMMVEESPSAGLQAQPRLCFRHNLDETVLNSEDATGEPPVLNAEDFFEAGVVENWKIIHYRKQV